MMEHVTVHATSDTTVRVKHFLDLARKEGMHHIELDPGRRRGERLARKVSEVLHVDCDELIEG